MLYRTAAIILAIIGVGAVLGGLTVAEMNHGSCHAIPTGGTAGCDYTFPGTNVWIGQTAQELGILGGILLIFSLVFYTGRGRSSAKDNAGRP